MSYKIVVDSCCELPEELKADSRFERVPLGLEVGDWRIMDDENFDQKEFLRKVAECPICPRSSCPSPQRYLASYEEAAEHIYVITLSSNLSGSYNSAVLGKNLFEEKYGKDAKKIHVIDSRSASCGETQIALKAMQLEEKGLPFEEIAQKLEAFRDEMNTYFVLNNLDTLRKNGRLTGVKALVASTLNIKPVMGGTPEGTIFQRGQAVGLKKALIRMAGLVVDEIKDPQDKCLMISHCNNREKAEWVRDMILEKAAFASSLILDTAGISSMYANDGGIIIAV
ncbi:MAG TPA: DegV family protein [Candidatus Eisenbergiella merdipullorum]|uniref:DegV family protein n=1 Tax=Candidatus Eisenbergiella merdipullorum TaxID=2838553 RepID=A0A9D2KZ78_9FIRM|nr:DegV family protein [Candidatus Eisenbergiella merdipullorum]